jgi:hypothetical protein
MCHRPLPAAAQAASWPTAGPPPVCALLVQQGFRIGQACPACLRGVVATRDLQPGDIIQAIPLTLAVWFRWVAVGAVLHWVRCMTASATLPDMLECSLQHVFWQLSCPAASWTSPNKVTVKGHDCLQDGRAVHAG